MSDNCPEVDIGVARNGEYWKRVGPRERQAAYRDWLDRERQRAVLSGARCELCVFWLDEAPESGDTGICQHSWGKVSGGEHLMKLRTAPAAPCSVWRQNRRWRLVRALPAAPPCTTRDRKAARHEDEPLPPAAASTTDCS